MDRQQSTGKLNLTKLTSQLEKDNDVSSQEGITNEVQDATEEAQRCLEQKDVGRKILVTGSLHLVGGVLQILEPESLL